MEPYLLPLTVSISPNGVSVRFKGPKIPILIGHLSFSLTERQAFQRYVDRLVICIGQETFIYDLSGTKVALALPNNLRGQSTVTVQGRTIYVHIPHPERLGAPIDVDEEGAPARNLVVGGSVTLTQGAGFSFALNRIVSGPSDVAVNDFGLLNAPFLLDLGPVNISSVRSLPEGPGVLRRAAAPLYDPIQRQFDLPGWRLGRMPSLGVRLRTGHTYGVMLGHGEHYALVQAIQVSEAEPVWMTIAYKYQPDGSPRF